MSTIGDGHAARLAEVWRGEILESVHFGHAAIVDASGQVVETFGNPETVIYPRSSVKMIQALPLIESGAADVAGLDAERLALACASHSGAAIHTERVRAWLSDLGLSEEDLRCGPQFPGDTDARADLIKSDSSPCQLHNNCSGKHSGFLTLARHLGAGPEYVEPDHPVQKAVLEAFEEVTQESSPGFGIDGCNAPNFATTVTGLARGMASFATAQAGSGVRQSAQARLVAAMMAHPDLVAGEGRCCTKLMRAARGQAVVKTGAEGVFVAIVPGRGLGIAVKIEDGATRASECAIAALLVRVGVIAPENPVLNAVMNVTLQNRRGLNVGKIRPASALI